MFLLIGLSAGALAMTGCARRAYTGSGAVVYAAPPSAQVVVHRPPVPYAGAVWVDGYHHWTGSQYVWVDGYYTQPRPGYVFVQPRWETRGGRHVFIDGGWSRGGRIVHRVTPPHHRVGVHRGHRAVQPRHHSVQRRGVVRQPHRGAVRAQPPRGAVRAQPSHRGAVRAQPPARGAVRAQPRGRSSVGAQRGGGAVRAAPPRGSSRGHSGGGRGGRGSVRAR